MGKYSYLVNYEAAIAQGISKEEYARESSSNAIQTWIANELAELNRLTRFELGKKYPQTTWEQIGENETGQVVQYPKDELEDKA